MKLARIRKEITLARGTASSKNIYDFAMEVLGDLRLDFEDYAGKLKKTELGQDPYWYLDDENMQAAFQQLEKQGVSEKFYSDVRKEVTTVADSGQYSLGMHKDRGGDIHFYLMDNQASNPGEYFVGEIRTTIKKKGYRYNLQKGFGLLAYEVHWSFVPKEKQGTGLGKILYSAVYDYITSQNAVMYSDSMLFEGSSKMWRKYMPTIAEFFGFQVNDIMLPCTANEVANIDWKNAKKAEDVDGFIAMDNPPKFIRKMAYNTTGLSYFNGDFGIIEVDGSVNDKVELGKREKTVELPIYNAIKSYNTVQELVKSFLSGDLRHLRRRWPAFAKSRGNKPKCVFLAFDDAILCVKDVNGEIVIVAI
jgi:hypothetical protein